VGGGEPLEQRIRRRRKAHLERAAGRVLTRAVENDHPAGATKRHEARQRVHQLLAVTERARVKNVVTVEKVEHTVRMPVKREKSYLEELVARLRRVLASDLVGVYGGGSWALGGYEPGRSDLDVAAVARGRVSRERLRAVVKQIRHESLPCPARGLEFVLYPLAAARTLSVDPGFLLNLNTGSGIQFRTDYEPAEGEQHWFAIDRSVLAHNGVALYGPPAAEIFAAPPPSQILPLLAETIRWYLREAPADENGVLNACRALHFAREGTWVAKQCVRSKARQAVAQVGGAEEFLRGAVRELEG
jgi:hypothetical protein